MMHLADFNLRRVADVDGARAKIHECMLLLTGDRQRASQAASAFSEVARAIVEHCSARVEVSIGRIGESRALQCILVTESQPPALLGADRHDEMHWRVVRRFDTGSSWVPHGTMDRLRTVLETKSHQELVEENYRLLHDKTTALNRLSLALSTVQDVDTLMVMLLQEAAQAFHCEAGSILLAEEGELVFRHALSSDTSSRDRLLVRAGDPVSLPIDRTSMAGAAALDGMVAVADAYNIPEGATFRFNPSVDRMMGFRTRAVVSVSLRSNHNELLGVLQLINPRDPESLRPLEFSSEDQALAMNFASLAALALERSNLTRTLVLRIMGIAELHDPKETGAHIRRVSQVATRLFVAWASRRGWSEERILKELDSLRPAAMLHDVGKVGISDIILKKPGALTDEERKVMQSHTTIGAKSALKGQRTALDAAIRDVTLYHHARWDGKGYPTRDEIIATLAALGENGEQVPEPRGEGIPLAGRLVAIADVFDALMSRRAYKEAWTPADVRAEFERLSGSHFDPELVELFLADFDSYCSIHAAISG